MPEAFRYAAEILIFPLACLTAVGLLIISGTLALLVMEGSSLLYDALTTRLRASGRRPRHRAPQTATR